MKKDSFPNKLIFYPEKKLLGEHEPLHNNKATAFALRSFLAGFMEKEEDSNNFWDFG